MKKHLLRAVGAHLGYDPHPDTVRWVLTVPAIWDENAKQFMREAAYRVSLVKVLKITNTCKSQNRIKIIYEKGKLLLKAQCSLHTSLTAV